jgi:regulator of protease activity HflC (stomatin/prohibitin superfamily)
MSSLSLLIPAIVVAFYILSQWVRVLNEYERGVVFRLGRVSRKPAGPGLMLLMLPPFIDRMVTVGMRTIALDVPSQDIITRDNVSVKVNAVVYYRVVDPIKAVTEIEDYHYATSQVAQTTLRAVLGKLIMDELLSEQQTINSELERILDAQTEPWGIKVQNVELKNVDLPQEMQRAMARQAEAERDRRAKVISAEGEFQAANKLVEAAKLMEEHPMSLQMRYLQTMVEVGAEKNTTIYFPVPIDFMEAFYKKMGGKAE